MGVSRYEVKGKTYWKVDEWLSMPDGTLRRFRKKKIPTREQAEMLAAKVKVEAFEGRVFDRLKTPKLTVAQAWEEYEPITRRDNDTWKDDAWRASNLCRLLGDRLASSLTQRDVDEYRNRRFAETTKRGGPPAPGTLDREIPLLKRFLTYAADCGRLPVNPIARVPLLPKKNVRRVVVSEADFAKLVACADEELRPILVVAYETGMRKREVLDLRWSQVDLKAGCLELREEDTKTNEFRRVYLTARALEALKAVPRRLRGDHVFVSPRTGKPYSDVQSKFLRAAEEAGLEGVWFHDLRRSFVTNARRRGVPESVVMRMSGHKTRSVFDRYNVVDDGDVKEAVRRIEQAVETEVRGVQA